MKGAVPQKGLKMKLSINQGPYVDGTDYGFVISREHCKQISDFLWDWKDSLPAQIFCNIEVITVNPTKRSATAGISIKMVLSGGEHSWKAQFEHTETYSVRDSVSISSNGLLQQLRSTLKDELIKYSSVSNEINSMISKLDVHY